MRTNLHMLYLSSLRDPAASRTMRTADCRGLTDRDGMGHQEATMAEAQKARQARSIPELSRRTTRYSIIPIPVWGDYW